MADTLAIAHNLTAAGITQSHAEAIANVLGQRHGDIATKDFVRSQTSTVRAEISALRGDMNAEIGTVRTEIGALRSDMNAETGALRGDIGALRADMNAEMSGVRAEIGALRGDMNTETGTLRGEINALRADMNAAMSALETRLVRWIVGTGIALAGIMSAAFFAVLQFMP